MFRASEMLRRYTITQLLRVYCYGLVVESYFEVTPFFLCTQHPIIHPYIERPRENPSRMYLKRKIYTRSNIYT